MNAMKIYLLLAIPLLILSACSPSALQDQETALAEPVVETNGVTENPTNGDSAAEIVFAEEDLDSALDDGDVIEVLLQDDTILVDGAAQEDTTLTIQSAGTYHLSGTLLDGGILIAAGDEDKVTLILDGVQMTSSTGSVINVQNAEKTIIELVSGSGNVLTDAAVYSVIDVEKDEPNAAIFSNDDLTIKGDGQLTVNANYRHGIVSDDDLKISSGSITINAVQDGLKGKSSVTIKDGIFVLNVGGDGIQSSETEDIEKGTIIIENGNFQIDAGLDGIQAATDLIINQGVFNITTGGGSVNGVSKVENWGGRMSPNNADQTTTQDTQDSAKGLKAGSELHIYCGTFAIDSADDSLHSDDVIIIEAGDLDLTSGDDGIHADTAITINGSMLDILESYEGIESALITINAGTIHIQSSDDGINVAGGADASGLGDRPGQGNFSDMGDYYLYIHDGYLYIDAGGDGLDSNGSIEMNGGTVIVNGPVNNANGALDYMGTFNVNGGLLIAAGSAGMAQAPSTTSSQYSLMTVLNGTTPAGTMLHFESSDGEDILTFVPAKEFQTILISTAQLNGLDAVNVYYGGSHSGSVVDGLYSAGNYSGGTSLGTYQITGVVTGSIGGGGMMPGGGRQRP